MICKGTTPLVAVSADDSVDEEDSENCRLLPDPLRNGGGKIIGSQSSESPVERASNVFHSVSWRQTRFQSRQTNAQTVSTCSAGKREKISGKMSGEASG